MNELTHILERLELIYDLFGQDKEFEQRRYLRALIEDVKRFREPFTDKKNWS